MIEPMTSDYVIGKFSSHIRKVLLNFVSDNVKQFTSHAFKDFANT